MKYTCEVKETEGGPLATQRRHGPPCLSLFAIHFRLQAVSSSQVEAVEVRDGGDESTGMMHHLHEVWS